MRIREAQIRGLSTSAVAALRLALDLLHKINQANIPGKTLLDSCNMGKKTVVPDAWDDDWESQADKTEEAATAVAAEDQVKISKAERLAKHAESNKQLWESA